MYDTIIYEVDDPVATITLNRPEAMNAWTNRMDREIRDAVARASADPAVVRHHHHRCWASVLRVPT